MATHILIHLRSKKEGRNKQTRKFNFIKDLMKDGALAIKLLCNLKNNIMIKHTFDTFD